MVQQLKYVLYLSRKYSIGCVCRDILPGLFTNRTYTNQGTNRQKWVPESLLWFSLRVVSLGKKAGSSPIFFGCCRKSTSPGLPSRPELQGNTAQTLPRSHKQSVPTFLLGNCISYLVHGVRRISAYCSSWPAGRVLGTAGLGGLKSVHPFLLSRGW